MLICMLTFSAAAQSIRVDQAPGYIGKYVEITGTITQIHRISHSNFISVTLKDWDNDPDSLRLILHIPQYRQFKVQWLFDLKGTEIWFKAKLSMDHKLPVVKSELSKLNISYSIPIDEPAASVKSQ